MCDTSQDSNLSLSFKEKILHILLIDDHVLFSRGLQFLLAELDSSARCTMRCLTAMQARALSAYC
jgi:DNA-binding NarL/FixJ family response regulator